MKEFNAIFQNCTTIEVLNTQLWHITLTVWFIFYGVPLFFRFLGHIVRRQREVKQKQIDEENIKKYKARVRTPIRMAENNKEELS